MSYVDITKKSEVTCVEWFHGYGGNALGLKRAIPGLRSVAVCERDAFVVANVVSKMEKGLLDAVPIWTDVTDFPCEPFGYQRLDFFAASYPCQGFSHAGKRLGVDDHRHLWPYCRRFIQSVRPGWVWLENVEGHVTLGLSTVLADLEEDGYTAAWGIFSASEVGAPHQRKRVFILAYGKRSASQQRREPDLLRGREGETEQAWVGGGEELALRDGIGLPYGEPKVLPTEARFNAQCDAAAGSGEDVAHLHSVGLGSTQPEQNRQKGIGGVGGSESVTGEGVGVWPSRPGERQHAWEPPRVVGNSGLPGQEERCLQTAGLEQHGEENGEYGQAQPPLGGNADGSADGLDFPGCTGLSNTELAEIREWMVKGTNRTDELRMCGNGVVPATAEKAFRVLYAELTGEKI